MRTALALLMSLFVTASATAQQPRMTQQFCAPFAELRNDLATKYHETEVGTGVSVNGQSVVIMFASPEGATWTLLELNTAGLACVLGVGANWDAGPMPEKPGTGA